MLKNLILKKPILKLLFIKYSIFYQIYNKNSLTGIFIKLDIFIMSQLYYRIGI